MSNVYSVVELLTGADATSPAAAGAATTTTIPGMGNAYCYAFLAELRGATGGVLDVVMEHSSDGTDWYEFGHWAQLTAAVAVTDQYISKVIASSTASVVGKNLTTTMTLAAGSIVSPPYFDLWRVRYVAGASTSAGAVQAIRVIKWRQPGT